MQERGSLAVSSSSPSLGSGFLVSFLLLSLPCSLMSYPAHNKGPIANLTDCLHFSEQLMKEANLSLLSFKKTCPPAMQKIYVEHPHNEDKIVNACMGGQSKTEQCLTEESNDVNKPQCLETIYIILKGYANKIRDFDSPGLLDPINNMMQVLKSNEKRIEASSKAKLPPGRNYQMDMIQYETLWTFQQFSEILHRTLSYLWSHDYNAERTIEP